MARLKKPRGGNAPSRVATPAERQDFSEDALKKGYREIPMSCLKCNGTGKYISGAWGGECWECGGVGKVLGRLYTEEKREALDEQNEKRKQRKTDKVMEKRNAAKLASLKNFPEAHQISAELLDEIDGEGLEAIEDKYGGFVVDVATKGELHGFTDRQAEALVSAYNKQTKILERKQAEAEELTAAPDGRQTIIGVVVHVTLRENQYGQSWKMIVMDDRKFKVWATVPKAVITKARSMGFGPEDIKGHKVVFDATLEVSKKDKSFAFGNRPSKADFSIISAASGTTEE